MKVARDEDARDEREISSGFTSTSRQWVLNLAHLPLTRKASEQGARLTVARDWSEPDLDALEMNMCATP